jgi:hypothetical protein
MAGLNVIAAVDGSLVPRSGLAMLGLTGKVNGQVSGLGWADGGSSPDKAWYVQGTSMHSFVSNTSGATVINTIGALSAPATRVIHAWDEAGVVWLTNYGDRIYKYVLATDTLTAIPYTNGPRSVHTAWTAFSSPGCTGQPGASTGRGDGLDDWPDLNPGPTPPAVLPIAEPANYVLIGSANSAVTGLFVVRGQLIVAKNDGSMWVVTGDLSTSKVPDSVYNVRQVYQGQTPLLEPQHGHHRRAVWMVGRLPWPSWFNGSNMNDLNYPRRPHPHREHDHPTESERHEAHRPERLAHRGHHR